MDKLTNNSSLIELYDIIVKNDPTLTTIDISKELYKGGVWSCNPKYKMIRGLLLFSLYKNNNIICVKLDNLLLKDCNLKRLIACDSIKELVIEWNNLGNKSIVYLSKMKNLESLMINSYNIRNRGLYPLVEMNSLRRLRINIYNYIDFSFLKYTRIKQIAIPICNSNIDKSFISEIYNSKIKHLGFTVYHNIIGKNIIRNIHNLSMSLSTLCVNICYSLEVYFDDISGLKFLVRLDLKNRYNLYNGRIIQIRINKNIIRQLLLNYNLRYVNSLNLSFDFSKHVNRNIHNYKIRTTKLLDLLLQ